MQATIHRQLNSEAVELILREALDHVETLDPPDDLREAVFAGAVRLAGLTLVQMPQVTPLDLPGLSLPNGGR